MGLKDVVKKVLGMCKRKKSLEVWYGVAWDGKIYDMVWYGTVRYGTVWDGMGWDGMGWDGVVWYMELRGVVRWGEA